MDRFVSAALWAAKRAAVRRTPPACFWKVHGGEPIEIAQTGRKTGINSDARYRLERHVDPELTIPGLELATKLILEICGGEVYDITVTGDVQPEEKVIDFPLAEITRLTGLKVPFVEVKAVLTRLGFWVAGSGDVVKVAVPSYRPDIEGKADLVEEVMRIVGVDNVPVDPLPPPHKCCPKNADHNPKPSTHRAARPRGTRLQRSGDLVVCF